MENIDYISRFTGIKPDMVAMARTEKERGVEIEEKQIEARLQKLFQQELLQRNIKGIEKLEEQFGCKFTIEPNDLQILYTRIIVGQEWGKCEPDIYKFLLERTGVEPSLEIIDARYRSLFDRPYHSPRDCRVVETFLDMVKIPPSSEMLQAKYEKIFDDYIHFDHSEWNNNGEEVYEDNGDKNFAVYTELIRITGIKPQFNRKHVLKLYEFCVNAGPKYHHKLKVIAQETGVEIDQDFIQKYLLDNQEFSSPVPLSISKDQLDRHFSHSQNVSFEEYKRIYQIFGCFDYYQDVLAELEKDKSKEAKQQLIALLSAMGLRDMKNREHYATIKERLLSFVEEKDVPIKKTLGEALAELAKNGDADLLAYLASTLRERTKTIEGKEGEEKQKERGVLGFSPLQEVSLRTMLHIDNPIANEHLLGLLFVSDIDRRVRSFILNNLVTKKPEFFPDNIKKWAEEKLTDKKSEVTWEDLRFFQATIKISSVDLRRKSLKYADIAFGSFAEEKISPSEVQKENFKYIPNDIFLPLWKFVRGDRDLLEKFNGLYKTTKSSTEKNALQFGIVNALSINKKTLEKVTDCLSKIDFTVSGTTQKLSMLLKTLSFLNVVERKLSQFHGEMLTILDSPVESLEALNESLKQIVVQMIQKVLPHQDINADTVQSLWEYWGSLEPIFIYAGKMSHDNYGGTLDLVAEMVANMDAPKYEGWRSWRYNLQDYEVSEQIGHLTDAQLEVWQGDHFAELGDIVISETSLDKPKKITNFIEGSLREGHVYNAEIHTSDRHKFIQDSLGATFMAIAEHPDQREVILNGVIESLRIDMEKIDAITSFRDLSKLEQILMFFAEGKELSVNAKTKNSITFLAQFLSTEQFQEMEMVYKEAEKNEASTIDTDRIIDSKTRKILMTKMEEIKRTYEEVLQSTIFEQYGFNKEQTKNVGQFYQKRQELKALLDLYRVSALDSKRIATNRISDRIDKKGETITSVIEGLKTYFKDNLTFVQDIENIQAVISQREDLGAERRLAMIVTDNPQMLFQAGKYPIGCGSCQNYEGNTEWNRSLAGYVADAHIKVAYLIDLNKLPDNIKQEINTKGFEVVKDSIACQDLLEASIARAITKITKLKNTEEPTLFIEPTYSSINKDDLSMDRFFNIFLDLTTSGPMGIRLTRGGGSETVMVAKSRNPNGQYEDCAAGNAGHAGMGIQTSSYTMSARFINKFTPVTDADRKLAERISGE